jgi:hypothetical protein
MCAKDKPMFHTRTMTCLWTIKVHTVLIMSFAYLKMSYGRIEDNKNLQNLLNFRKIRLIEGNAKCRHLKKFT